MTRAVIHGNGLGWRGWRGCVHGILSFMARVHDVGGQEGFGPVPAGDDGQPFGADWEARVYALNAVLRQRGLYDGDQMRDAIERIPPQEYLGASYYERWLLAMEDLLAQRGIG